MRRRNRLAWKLSVAVLVIVSAVILATGYVGNYLSRRSTLQAAREIMHFNAASITSGVEKLMLTGDSCGMIDFIGGGSATGRAALGDMGLVAHPSGEVLVSSPAGGAGVLGPGDEFCLACHDAGRRPLDDPEPLDVIVTGPGGVHVLQIVTPVTNKTECRNAACHAHVDDGEILAILHTGYSLAALDQTMSALKMLLAVSAVVAVVLAIGALLLNFRWIIAKPLRHLVAGLERLGSGDLGFRFPEGRDDEIGLVADSFNNMAERIQEQQNELIKTLDHMQGIVENTADIVLFVDRDDIVRTFNRGAELALGYARNEVLGRRIEMLLADSRERDIAIARLQGIDNVTNWQTRFRTRDGQVRHVVLTITRHRDPDGHLLGTIGIGKDMTVRIDLQEKLARAEQEAAIGRAVTGIQHAIKNMLNTLKGGVYIVRVGQKRGNDEQIDEGCEMIDEGLTQITGLSVNMLRYAREWNIDPEPVDMERMARKIITAVGQTATERGIALRTAIAANLPEVMCDPRLVHMGLMDIVSNALDACTFKEYRDDEVPELVIGIAASSGGGDVVVEVKDNGIGMTREIASNVFTPFFSTKKKWGTGLGLALTKRIVDLHDGEIAVESEPEIGTVFRITLPLHGIATRTGEAP